MDGLLKKEDDAKKAGFDDATAAPKRHSKPIKQLKIKGPLKKKISCRRCGYMMGLIEVVDNKWSTWTQAISKKFGTRWPICQNCRNK